MSKRYLRHHVSCVKVINMTSCKCQRDQYIVMYCTCTINMTACRYQYDCMYVYNIKMTSNAYGILKEQVKVLAMTSCIGIPCL